MPVRKKLIIVFIAVACVVAAALTTLVLLFKKQTQVNFTLSGSEQIVEIAPGEFPYGEYRLTLTRPSGETEEVALTEDMIPENEKIKLYRQGEQSITVFYNGASCEIAVNVKMKSLSRITLEDKTAVYTGKPCEICAEGDIPADATVRYPYGNSFVNAGEYDVTAVIYGDCYETLTLTAKLTVLKADYDMSGVTFPDGDFTYDGREKTVEVKGELPKGLTVSYTIGAKQGNGAIYAGEYEVTASFTSDNPNYNAVDDMRAKLTVGKAAYDMQGVTLTGEQVTYDKETHSARLSGNLPDGVTLSCYTTKKIKNSDGSLCEEEESEGNGATGAGEYLITAYFTVADAKNYLPVQPITAEIIIDRAEYGLAGINLSAASFTYDGEVHSVVVEGEQAGSEAQLPAGVSVRYTVKKINDPDGSMYEGEENEGNGATESGAYLVTAYFVLSDQTDYLPVQPLSALLVISRATVEVKGTYLFDGRFEYDGNEHFISLTGDVPQGFSVNYTIKKIKNSDGSLCVEENVSGNGATEAGTYEVVAELVCADVNYVAEPGIFSAYLIISAPSGGEE
ncbi:MAG: MBG domain-containing protein [Candidatus Scatosoma sp.]